MIDDTADDYGEDEPTTSRADWVAMRERLLAQRRESMWRDAYEVDWFAHHVGKLIPEFRDHPLFLATLRAHWLSPSTVSAKGDPDLEGVEGVPSDARIVVTIDPDDLKSDLPGLAREIARTLRQHPWPRAVAEPIAPTTSFNGRALATALLALRRYRKVGR